MNNDTSTDTHIAPPTLSSDEQRFLLDLSRRTIERYLTDGTTMAVDAEQVTEGMRRNARCFVTLHLKGALRGCIGYMAEDVPLIKSVIQSSISAATHDYRFPPLTLAELQLVSIEISVLTPSRRLHHNSVEDLLTKLEPGVHGVVLRCGGFTGLFLPQMWDHFEGENQIEAFLVNLSHKAGDSSGKLWRNSRAEYEVFEVVHFNDEEDTRE